MDAQVRRLLVEQAQVVSRGQLHELGMPPHDIRRLVRRRELTRLHDGVFIGHRS